MKTERQRNVANPVTSNAEIAALARRYRTALRRFLRQAPAKSSTSAGKLGSQAAALGLETLAIAGIHERALKTVSILEGAPGNVRQEMIKRAEIFFKETIVPIEATHPAACKADARIVHLDRALRRRTGELSASFARLKQATARRKGAENRTANRKVYHDSLLAEAQRMQKHLRDRMRGLLSQQEGGRKRIGNELRDEIAQALLAIDIRLLALNSSGLANIDETEKSIADARRIVLNHQANGIVPADGQDSL